MAQIASNPWSFVSADQAASVAITSIVSNGFTALVTTSSAHGLTEKQNVSLQGCTTTPAYNGGYKVLSAPTTTTFFIQLTQPNLAANGANGNVLTVAYPYKIRAEQIIWSASAAGTVTLTDTNGNTVWTYTTASDDPEPTTYGKVYWIDGLVINALPNGTLSVTVN